MLADENGWNIENFLLIANKHIRSQALPGNALHSRLRLVPILDGNALRQRSLHSIEFPGGAWEPVESGDSGKRGVSEYQSLTTKHLTPIIGLRRVPRSQEAVNLFVEFRSTA